MTSPGPGVLGTAKLPDPAEVAAVVFDCDGLLVDTEPHWYSAECAVYANRGHTTARTPGQAVGSSVPASCRRMAVDLGEEDWEALQEELLGLVRDNLSGGVRACSGALEFVRACAAAVPVALASNSPRSVLEVTLDRAGLAELIPVTVAADEVPNPKPDPDLYLAACDLLGVDPQRSVAFEDSVTGAAAAVHAGLFVVAIPSAPEPRVPAHRTVDSFLDPHLAHWARMLAHRG